MFTDDRVLEDLKALNILDIARDLGREPNRQNKIHCTFHDENTPSMKLNPKTGRFKCFGCGANGSTIDLYASGGRGLEFGQAVKEMKHKYLHIFDGASTLPQRQAKPVVLVKADAQPPAELFSATYEALQTFCRQYPATDIKRQALAYLTARAFAIETIQAFGLFVIPDVKATTDFLLSSYSREHLQQSGLFSPPNEKSKGGFMFYKHALIIPYLKNGRIVNLQGRCIGEPPAKGWKYQFLHDRPNTDMFNVDVLGGLAQGSKVYLTEGAFDAMALTQKGGPSVSINSSTSFKPEWVDLFAGLRACFLFDNDPAGKKAIETLTPLFQQKQIPLSMKSLPDGCKDVNEWLILWGGHINGYPAFWDR